MNYSSKTSCGCNNYQANINQDRCGCFDNEKEYEINNRNNNCSSCKCHEQNNYQCSCHKENNCVNKNHNNCCKCKNKCNCRIIKTCDGILIYFFDDIKK